MEIKPKKSLGQVFLIDKNIQKKIIKTCDFKSQDYILEIGSGRGELTDLLSKIDAKIFALEVDNQLYEQLKEKFKGNKNVKVFKKSILDFDIKRNFQKIYPKKIKVLGNIPYYITTPIILHLIKYHQLIEEAFLTVQKEFGKRVVAPCGSKLYGAISCLLQYYTEPKVLFFIKKNSFYPKPKVDSCFLNLKFKENLPLSASEEKLLFKIIRTSFNQRRKALRNTLKEIIPSFKWEEFCEKFKVSYNLRPEDLSINDFINLTKLSLNRSLQ